MKLGVVACILISLACAACGPDGNGSSVTDITGAMPRLAFSMQRASDGAEVTARQYRGKIVVLYFGYTHCPDICPTTLANLSDVLHRLGSSAGSVRVLFVTVDPERDTLPVLKEYARAFATQIEGLRGDDNSLTDLARRYRVAFEIKKSSPGQEYSVMHSDAVFIFDRDGRARLVATSTDDVGVLATDLRNLLR